MHTGIREQLVSGRSHKRQSSGKIALNRKAGARLKKDGGFIGSLEMPDINVRVARLGKTHPHQVESIYHTNGSGMIGQKVAGKVRASSNKTAGRNE